MGHLWFAWCLYWLLPVVIGDCDDDEDDDNDTHKSSRNMVVASRQNTETTFSKKPLVQTKKSWLENAYLFAAVSKELSLHFLLQ